MFVMLPLDTVLGIRHGEEYASEAQRHQEEALALALDKLASAKVKVWSSRVTRVANNCS